MWSKEATCPPPLPMAGNGIPGKHEIEKKHEYGKTLTVADEYKGFRLGVSWATRHDAYKSYNNEGSGWGGGAGKAGENDTACHRALSLL